MIFLQGTYGSKRFRVIGRLMTTSWQRVAEELSDEAAGGDLAPRNDWIARHRAFIDLGTIG